MSHTKNWAKKLLAVLLAAMLLALSASASLETSTQTGPYVSAEDAEQQRQQEIEEANRLQQQREEQKKTYQNQINNLQGDLNKLKEEQKNLRYNRIAFEAAKQSGRGVVPQVELPVTYKQMLADAARNDAAFFCYEAGGEPLLSRLGGAETIGLITGSEGGFSPEEAAAAREAGCVQIGLGPRILRCETAPLAALAAVMTLTGNLQ